MWDWLLGLGLTTTDKDAYLTRVFVWWIATLTYVTVLGWTWIGTAWKNIWK